MNYRRTLFGALSRCLPVFGTSGGPSNARSHIKLAGSVFVGCLILTNRHLDLIDVFRYGWLVPTGQLHPVVLVWLFESMAAGIAVSAFCAVTVTLLNYLRISFLRRLDPTTLRPSLFDGVRTRL